MHESLNKASKIFKIQSDKFFFDKDNDEDDDDDVLLSVLTGVLTLKYLQRPNGKIWGI